MRIEDVADVGWGPEPARGTAGYNTQPAVVLSVQKAARCQHAGTHRGDRRSPGRPRPALPAGVVIETENFRQADFIEVAIHNVDGSPARRRGARRHRALRLPRKLAHDADLGPGDPAVAGGGRARGVALRRHHQHHDPGRPDDRYRRSGGRRHHRRRERLPPSAPGTRETSERAAACRWRWCFRHRPRCARRSSSRRSSSSWSSCRFSSCRDSKAVCCVPSDSPTSPRSRRRSWSR